MLQYSFFLILAPVAVAMVVVIAGYAWLRPDSPVARALAAYLLAVAGFLAANIAELTSGSPGGAELFTRVQYLFIPFIPVLWLRFAFIYTGREHWADFKRIWLFGLLPVATIVLAWSNQYHGLLWAAHEFRPLGETWGSFWVLRYGPWFWAQGVYSYLLLLAGAVLIALEAVRGPRLFRQQSLAVISGATLPLVFNLIYAFRLLPGLTKDYTPLMFALAGLTFAYSIFRQRLLSISPVARAVLIESMQDPMFVLDEHQRVIDMNPAALRFLGVTAEDTLGNPFSKVWPAGASIGPLAPDATRPLGWAGAQNLAMRIAPIITVEDQAAPEGAPAGAASQPLKRSYELHVSPLAGRQHAAGWLVVLHDLTQRHQAEEALEEANRALAEAYREVAEKGRALAKTNDTLLHMNEELEARVLARTQTLRQRAAELEALTHVSSALRLANTFDKLLATLLRETAATLDFGAGVVLLNEDDRLRVAAVHNRPESLQNSLYPPGSGPLWKALQLGKLDRFDIHPASDPHLTALAGDYPTGIVAPMQAAGHSMGLLVFFYEPQAGPSQHWPLAAIAEMGANAIQRVRLMETLEQLVADRTRDLSTLYDVTTTTNAYQNLDTILSRILEKALDVLRGRVGLVHLLDERPDPRYTLADQPRPPETALRLATALGLVSLAGADDPNPAAQLIGRDHPGPWSEVYQRNSILVLTDLLGRSAGLIPRTAPERPASNMPDHLRAPTRQTAELRLPAEHPLPESLTAVLRARNAGAYVGVPIHAKGRVLGVMSVFGESLASFSAEDIALLAAIADHVGGAVENAQLRMKAEEAAVMEERQRLARDLHDSVTQALYSQVLFAQAGRDALDPTVLAEDGERETVGASGNVARARTMFDRLGESAQQALKELRLLIYELRPQALLSEGLTGALRQRLETVEQRAGVRTQLLTEHAAELPPEMETGLYGIAQEALNNVLKHARASQVTVRFEVWPERVELEVSDNGCGFLINPAQPTGGIGLASMRERAAALGGTLAVRSEIDRGTSILVSLRREATNDRYDSDR